MLNCLIKLARLKKIVHCFPTPFLLHWGCMLGVPSFYQFVLFITLILFLINCLTSVVLAFNVILLIRVL